MPTGECSSPEPARGRRIPTTSRRRSSSSSTIAGVDMVTVVTEAIFSYCGVHVKIDTDRHVGAERQIVRADGRGRRTSHDGAVRSQMLSLGGVNHLTGGTNRGPRDHGDAAGALQRRGRSSCRSTGLAARPASREAAGRRRRRRGADARGCGPPRSGCSRSSGTSTSTRSWWSTTTSRACCPSTRPGTILGIAARPGSGQGTPIHAGQVLQRRQPRDRLGRDQHRGPARRSSTRSTRRCRGRGSLADGRDDRRAPRVLRAGRRRPMPA